MPYAEIWLSYFKQGDDLGHHVDKASSIPEAFGAHADQMIGVAEHLRAVKEVLEEVGTEGVEIDAGTHHIGISAPENVIQALVNKDLATIPEWLGEEEEEYDDELPEDYEEENAPDPEAFGPTSL